MRVMKLTEEERCTFNDWVRRGRRLLRKDRADLLFILTVLLGGSFCVYVAHWAFYEILRIDLDPHTAEWFAGVLSVSSVAALLIGVWVFFKPTKYEAFCMDLWAVARYFHEMCASERRLLIGSRSRYLVRVSRLRHCRSHAKEVLRSDNNMRVNASPAACAYSIQRIEYIHECTNRLIALLEKWHNRVEDSIKAHEELIVELSNSVPNAGIVERIVYVDVTAADFADVERARFYRVLCVVKANLQLLHDRVDAFFDQRDVIDALGLPGIDLSEDEVRERLRRFEAAINAFKPVVAPNLQTAITLDSVSESVERVSA